MNKPLVVGYKGEIGSFILNGLLRVMPKALNILCVDINESEEEVAERIKMSDTIFLCVPMDKTVNWLVRHRELLKGKMVIEQCSLKEWVYEDWRTVGIDIKSMHILFRPSQTPNLEDRRLGLIRGQWEKGEWEGGIVDELLKITQSEPCWHDNVKQHDKKMAIQQALAHRVLLVLGEILGAGDAETYISKKVLELTKRIKQGDKSLYGLIQGNRHLPEKIEEMKEAFDEFELERYWK